MCFGSKKYNALLISTLCLGRKVRLRFAVCDSRQIMLEVNLHLIYSDSGETSPPTPVPVTTVRTPDIQGYHWSVKIILSILSSMVYKTLRKT
jgi:hypothetical protein